jgi:uncharacterized membrane protein YgcG
MKIRIMLGQVIAISIIMLMAVPPAIFAQDGGGKPAFKQEELDQMLAPIALYPDSLLTQILMASTYPLEVVQADRWAKQNKDMKGDALAKTLEAQTWDPSVKSLVNFPQVLSMMSEKIDLTQKLGNAFLVQQKDVMATIQKLRAKAQAAGNLKTTKEQVVKVEKEVIIIESPSPQVIYVPAYNPTVVYGVWAYPAYPPYPYYPPGYTAGAAFVTGVAVGAAWGYAWGHSDWHGGSVNVNYNQNINYNNNINRSKYATQYPSGQGQWKQQATTSQQVQARQSYRGYTGSALTPQEQQQAQQKAQQKQTTQQTQQKQTAQQKQQKQTAQQKQQKQTAQGGGAFEGMDRGSSVKNSSARGSSSRESMSRGSGGFSGGSRGGGRSGGGRR